ncbi:hypothetical protein L8C07_25610 [Paenibacillus sp. CMAA1739]|uniref:hypothetical protein n=1 Tax=Paenibacillus ottowii TaxID=2315729 RepID=UPI002DBDE492|nr:hypothetical protein [Paenibacillus sp. CMAA1739]MEC4569327.1 hypothetical protein [Paenibacillus sp. CMAA1739]
MSERTVDLIRKDVQSAKNEAKKNILLPVREVQDLLALVDSLQQKLESNNLMVSRIGELKRQLRVVSLREKMAEKDRTIAALELESKGHKALKGYAKILLSFIEPDGTPVDSYSFREIAKELRTTVTALGE